MVQKRDGYDLEWCFFFNDTATTEIYPLSLHDALPIWGRGFGPPEWAHHADAGHLRTRGYRSEEHTSELQSLRHLVCRLLLEQESERGVLTSTHLIVPIRRANVETPSPH